MVEMPFFLIIIIIAPSVRYELMEYDAVLQIAFLLMYKHARICLFVVLRN